MPCMDGGPTPEQEEREQRDRQTMIRLACDRCRELERKGEVPEWALGWWEQHKADDRERLAMNKRAKQQEMVRKRAMAKLTPEERDELGV